MGGKGSKANKLVNGKANGEVAAVGVGSQEAIAGIVQEIAPKLNATQLEADFQSAQQNMNGTAKVMVDLVVTQTVRTLMYFYAQHNCIVACYYLTSRLTMGPKGPRTGLGRACKA